MPDDAALTVIQRTPGEPEAPPFQVVFERLHRVRRKASHWVDSHVHHQAEFMLPTSGRYRARVAGSLLEVPAGGIVLIAPGDSHADQCSGPVGFYSILVHIVPGPAPGRSRGLLAPDAPAEARTLASAPEVHAVAERLLADGPAATAGATRVQDALATELLWRVLARLPRSALAPDLLPAVERADFAAACAAACARHLRLRPTAGVLARELAMAERTLTTRCRQVLGEAPMHVFRRQQMHYARSLLASGGMSVSAVASHLGFANPFHFSTVFKRIIGLPPSQAGIDMPTAGTGMAPARKPGRKPSL
jgi:AraC-like DNA-binding protein